jgi:TPR repeat protein
MLAAGLATAAERDPFAAASLDPRVQEGVRYEHGEGVARDPERAARLYCEAARSGVAEAQFRLGWMYANGRGIGRNNRVAASLFSLASQQGHEYATRMVAFVGSDKGELPSCLTGPEDAVERPAPPYSTLAENARNTPFPTLPPPQASTASEREPLPVWAFKSAERQKVVELVHKLAPAYQVDPGLALAIIQAESGFNQNAVSPKNAQGLMQLIPETAQRFGVKNSFDPVENIKGGLSYLRWLLAYFEGNVALAAAAYNAGERTVERYKGVPPYAETREYVKKIVRYFPRSFHPFDGRVADPSLAFSARTTR